MKPHTLLELHLLQNATACQLSGCCMYFSLVLFCLCWTCLRLSALSIPLRDEPELHGNCLFLPLQLGLSRKLYQTGEDIQDPLKNFLIQKQNEIVSVQGRFFFREPWLCCSVAPFQQKSRQRVQEHSLTQAITRACTQNWDPGRAPGSVSLGVTTV